jgi:trans-AT polyketide synthase/acyltransferase/oxidoreductase domain-containing protein
MLTYVFPGQGSQRRGMGGAALFAEFPAEVVLCDRILGYSIQRLCLEDPDRQLDQTQYTQPALFVVGVLEAMRRQRSGAPAPAFLAGHSLGEYCALCAAGAFDLTTGLELVKRRGELMARARGGGMAAVVGLAEQAVRQVLADAGLGAIDVANLNAPTQVVLAGPQGDLRAAGPAFEKRGARYLPLKVSAPFHSRYMQEARDEFASFLERFPLRDPRLPVIANTTARPYEPGALRQTLAEQLRRPVRWTESVHYLVARGVTDFAELGDGGVLTRLIQQIRAVPAPAEAPPPSVNTTPTPAVPAPTPTLLVHPAARAPRVAAPAASPADDRLSAESLGSAEFRRRYGVRYAYASGSMYRAIASEDLVVRMARAGLLAFFGTAGLPPARVEQAIFAIRGRLPERASFGMNLLATSHEAENVELFLRHQIDLIEASAYVQLTPALVRYRLAGLRARPDGSVEAQNRIIAKVSRPEVAETFLAPAPGRLCARLLETGAVTANQVALARRVPMADDVCVEADSGGHTDQGVAYVLMPAMLRLRDALAAQHGYAQRVHIGAAGGIGTPEAAAAALIMGAEFLVTGSINQCTVEAGQSEAVKDLLEKMNVQDTDYAPAGDMFETGARVQVLSRGVFFPARANRLYDLYRNFPSLDALDASTRAQLEQKYFGRTFAEVFEEVRRYKPAADVERAERDPKYKMRLTFQWYFAHTNRLAFAGDRAHQVDFQIHCGPALGAFNQWVRDTPLQSWRNRHVDEIAERLMQATAVLLGERLAALGGTRADARAA